MTKRVSRPPGPRSSGVLGLGGRDLVRECTGEVTMFVDPDPDGSPDDQPPVVVHHFKPCEPGGVPEPQ